MKRRIRKKKKKLSGNYNYYLTKFESLREIYRDSQGNNVIVMLMKQLHSKCCVWPKFSVRCLWK